MKQWLTNNKRVIYVATAFLILLSFLGCPGSGTSKKIESHEQKQPVPLPVVYKKPPSGFRDTLFITCRSAVFYNSDSVQLEKIKAITEKKVYESNIHDCFYQMRNARMALKKYWHNVQITETSKARYLLFCKFDNSKICVDLNNYNDQCGLFLFDERKNPQLVDMMNIDTELGFYFSR